MDIETVDFIQLYRTIFYFQLFKPILIGMHKKKPLLSVSTAIPSILSSPKNISLDTTWVYLTSACRDIDFTVPWNAGLPLLMLDSNHFFCYYANVRLSPALLNINCRNWIKWSDKKLIWVYKLTNLGAKATKRSLEIQETCNSPNPSSPIGNELKMWQPIAAYQLVSLSI